MVDNAHGRHCRKGITQAEFFRRLANDAAAMKWYIQERWGDARTCPHCGSTNVNMRGETFRHAAPLPRQGLSQAFLREDWNLDGMFRPRFPRLVVWFPSGADEPWGMSPGNLHRDPGATWKTAWFVCQRLLQGMIGQAARLTGDIEVDETYIGGKRRNKSLKKRKALAGLGRGTVGKAIVTDAVSRKTGKVVVKEIPDTGRETLQGFVDEVAQEGVAVCTDEHRSHVGLDKRGKRRHETGPAFRR